MDADQIAETLSSTRLEEADIARRGEEEEEEEDDRCALKKADAEYDRLIQYLLEFLASAIKASDGDMQSAIVVGALKALHDRLRSPFWSAGHNGTSITITPNLYEHYVDVIKRLSRSNLSWNLIAKAPDAKITCIIQIKHGLYHLGVYDSSLKPVASGYIIHNGFLQGVDLGIEDAGRRSVSFFLMSQNLAERSGLDVGPDFLKYIVALTDANERIIFKEAYARAAAYNQSVYSQTNAADDDDNGDDDNNDDDGEAIVDEKQRSSTGEDDNGDDEDDSEATVDDNERSSTGGDGNGSDNSLGDDTSDDSIDRRIASIGQSQTDELFNRNRRFA